MRRRNRRHAQLNLAPLRQTEFDFAVLRFASFGNVQARHDLEARYQGPPVAGRDALVFLTAAVDPHANHRVTARRIGLNVDVRGTPLIGINNDLVGQAHDRAVVFANAPDVVVVVVADLHGLVGEFPQDVLNGAQLGLAVRGAGKALQNVFA